MSLFTCPLRHGGGPANIDYWRTEEEDGIRYCSFCDGFHPDDAANMITNTKLVFEVSDSVIKDGESLKPSKIWFSLGERIGKYYRVHDNENFIQAYNEIYKKQTNGIR
jgi:hypothetical protein